VRVISSKKMVAVRFRNVDREVIDYPYCDVIAVDISGLQCPGSIVKLTWLSTAGGCNDD
jgi:hypothetical protein